MKPHTFVFIGAVSVLYFLPHVFPTLTPEKISGIAITLMTIVWWVTILNK